MLGLPEDGSGPRAVPTRRRHPRGLGRVQRRERVQKGKHGPVRDGSAGQEVILWPGGPVGNAPGLCADFLEAVDEHLQLRECVAPVVETWGDGGAGRGRGRGGGGGGGGGEGRGGWGERGRGRGLGGGCGRTCSLWLRHWQRNWVPSNERDVQ